VCGLGILPACTVEVVEGPAAGAGGTGGTAGAAGAGGAKGDAASPEAAAPDAPADGAPSTDAAGGDVTADGATTDTAVDGPAADGPAADISTTPDASPDVADASTGESNPPDAFTPDGAIADAPLDAGGGCFAEESADAGATGNCAMLPYYGNLCSDDAGTAWPPTGASLCDTLEPDLKVSAFNELFNCLKVLPGADGGMDACGMEHDQGAEDCSRGIFNRSMCPVADGVAEGGLYGCTQIAASCGPDSGDGGIPVELCRAWLGPFNATARQGIIECYLDPTDVGATSCRDKFENYCVFP
jgi:hypothetical protein